MFTIFRGTVEFATIYAHTIEEATELLGLVHFPNSPPFQTKQLGARLWQVVEDNSFEIAQML